MTQFWFITFLILLFIELITVNLVTIWFAIGSLGALITALQSKGIDPITAKQLLVLGFIQPFSNELPLEYVVELNRLLKLDINK